MKEKQYEVILRDSKDEVFYSGNDKEIAIERFQYARSKSMKGHGRFAELPVLLKEDGVTIAAY